MAKAWSSKSCFRREVGAAPEGKGIRGKEHGEGPSSLFAEAVEGRHVDAVYIGALFAIDFDIDEVLVHKVGSHRVFKTFVGHDVAPVAGGVADGKQNGLVAFLGFPESLFTPSHPVYWIILVLKEIGAGFLTEEVM